MTISCIVAVAKNNVIGMGNEIPWHLPSDLKYFKKTTSGHTVIMGRKTFESIGKPLRDRTNIVISRDLFYKKDGVYSCESLEEAFDLVKSRGESEVFIIGGGMVYDKSQDYWDRIYITEIDLEVEGDVFFPCLGEEWEMVYGKKIKRDYNTPYMHTIKVLERIRK